MKVITNLAGKPYLVLLSAGVIALTVLAVPQFTGGKQSRPINPTLKMKPANIEMTEGRSMLVEMEEAFVSLNEAASPAVVHISPANGANGAPESQGQGSGFVYTSDGWIVTNDHVVAGAKEVTVTLANEKQFKGTVYSAEDLQIDLALVKIDASGLNTLTLAADKPVKPGQYAIALGSPFNLADTMTIGHISAINRPGEVFDPRLRANRLYSGMIQTDASINPGNSGGPLLNIEGEVIGINSSIMSSTMSSAGIGFAIPAKTVKVVADEIIQNKKFDRGLIGIVVEELKPYEVTDMKISGGARAQMVNMDGPAFKAGLRDNDVIVQVDDEQITNQSDLLRATYKRSPGDTVNVTYLRDGKENTIKVKLADPSELIEQTPQQPQPQQRQRQQQPEVPDFFRQFGDPEFFPQPDQPQATPETGKPKLGVQVEELDENNRRQFDIKDSAKGVVISVIYGNSAAERSGMEQGDVIQSINGTAIASINDLQQAMGKLNWGDQISVKVLRGGNEVTLKVRLN